MKKILIIFFLIILVSLGVGIFLNFEDKLDKKNDFLQELDFGDKAIFCGEYVLNLEDITEMTQGDYSIYEYVKNNGYKKIGKISEYDFSGKIVISNDYFIFINLYSSYISVYNKDELKYINGIGLKDYSVKNVLGVKNNDIYMSANDNKTVDSLLNLKYNINTSAIEIIENNAIPKQFDYQVCN